MSRPNNGWSHENPCKDAGIGKKIVILWNDKERGQLLATFATATADKLWIHSASGDHTTRWEGSWYWCLAPETSA